MVSRSPPLITLCGFHMHFCAPPTQPKFCHTSPTYTLSLHRPHPPQLNTSPSTSILTQPNTSPNISTSVKYLTNHIHLNQTPHQPYLPQSSTSPTIFTSTKHIHLSQTLHQPYSPQPNTSPIIFTSPTIFTSTKHPGGRSAPEVVCWTPDNWVAGSNHSGACFIITFM